MKKNEKQFYLVDLAILPEAIKKTIKVREILNTGEASSINDAVHKVGISRSTFYKYKDHVAAPYEERGYKVATLFVIMQVDLSAFIRIIRKISKYSNEIISVNKSRVTNKLHALVITFNTDESENTLIKLQESLKETKGIQSLTMKLEGDFDEKH